MNHKFIRKGIIATLLLGTFLAPTAQVLASDTVLIFTEQVKEDKVKGLTTSQIAIPVLSVEEIKLEKIMEERSFVEIGEEGFLIVSKEANEDSEAVGKLYENSLIKIVDKNKKWTQIESGNISGFIKTERLTSNRETFERAKEILRSNYSEEELIIINKEEIVKSFSVGETIEEENARLAEEEAKRQAEEAARIEAERIARQQAVVARGESVVAFAKQFLGNPYVYGGTSLTNGTDCSGFVKGVYAHFGISLPRTSSSMRGVGYAVSFDEIMPGDIVCYSGHVGIYAGNGQIVNAIDESRGIGMTRVNYAPIITIRRLP